jgi:Na+-driven multidrug efflux pump
MTVVVAVAVAVGVAVTVVVGEKGGAGRQPQALNPP